MFSLWLFYSTYLCFNSISTLLTRYQKEMEEYQKTDAYKNFLQKQRKTETPSPPKKTRKENGEERKEEEEEEEEVSTTNVLGHSLLQFLEFVTREV